MTKVRVVYIERADGEKNVIETEVQWIGGIRVGIIRQVIKRKERESDIYKKIREKKEEENDVDKKTREERKEKENSTDKRGKRGKLDKQDKKLLRRVKRMCDNETIVVGNGRMVQDFALSNTLFELKRKELLDNAMGIIDYLCGRNGSNQRRTFLLIVDSEKWKQSEIEEILNVVKNRYENIYINNRAGRLDMENMAAFFYEEYGMVLHFVDGLEVRQLKVDTVFFLVKDWNKKYAEIAYCNAYTVEEIESGQKRRRKRLHGELSMATEIERRKKENYMGLVYSYRGKQIPYELAIVIKYHEYLQHFFGRNVAKNEISIVAIYGVEWYN